MYGRLENTEYLESACISVMKQHASHWLACLYSVSSVISRVWDKNGKRMQRNETNFLWHNEWQFLVFSTEGSLKTVTALQTCQNTESSPSRVRALSTEQWRVCLNVGIYFFSLVESDSKSRGVGYTPIESSPVKTARMQSVLGTLRTVHSKEI